MSYRVNGTDLDNFFESREGRPLNVGWSTDDISDWAGPASRMSIVTPSDAPSVPTCFQIASTTDVDFRSATRFSVDPSKRYRVSTWARQIGSDQNCYLLVGFYNSSGNLISNTTTPNNTGLGWDSSGTYNYWQVVNEPIPDDWTYYEREFGNGQFAQIPPTAVTAVVGALTSRNSATLNNTQFNNYRIEEIPVVFGDELFTQSLTGGSGTEAAPQTFTFSTSYVGKALLRLNIFDAESGIVTDFNGVRQNPAMTNPNETIVWYEFEVNTVSGTNTIEVYRVNTDGYALFEVEVIATPEQPGGATPGSNINYFRGGSNFATRYEILEHDSRIPDIPYFENGVSLSRFLKADVSQYSSTLKGRAESTVAWNGSVNALCRFTFASSAALDDFFTFGGRLIISSARHSGSNSAKNLEWSKILRDAGTIEITKSLIMQNSSNVISSIGLEGLTTTNQTIYSGSGTSTYSSAVYQIVARRSTTTMDITVTFTDGASGVIDEDINGRLQVFFDERRHPSQASPTFTLLNDL